MLAIPVLLAGLVLGALRGAWWLAGSGLAVMSLFALGRLLGGMYWWGGWRCRHCGHEEMLR
ncbi:MAG: hypothetical protein QM820_63460 [Minicystis sp.]